MEKPNVSAAIRRTRRNVIAMGKLLGVALFGIALSPRGADAAATGGKPCFLKGTRIRVVGGEKKIEDIRIGDFVVVGTSKAGALGGATALSEGAGRTLGREHPAGPHRARCARAERPELGLVHLRHARALF